MVMHLSFTGDKFANEFGAQSSSSSERTREIVKRLLRNGADSIANAFLSVENGHPHKTDTTPGDRRFNFGDGQFDLSPLPNPPPLRS